MKRRRFSLKKKYELIKEVDAGVAKEFTSNKYRIIDRLYNRVINNESEVLVKVKGDEFEKKLQQFFLNK